MWIIHYLPGLTKLTKRGRSNQSLTICTEEKPAAVKILNEDLSHNAQIVERFRNEAKVTVKLNHPNIRQVYDFSAIDGRPCMVMEYLEGADLSARMKRGERFSDGQLQKWWNQLASALNYTHGEGVVHRDIKPSNIFVTDKGDVKLLDFGIAKVRDSITSTVTGAMMGTLMYMSPEQVRDSKHIDAKTDLYSLAVTFVHLLTGCAPYDRDTTDDYEIRKNIVETPLDLSGLSSTWQNLLRPYLAKNPVDRPELTEFTAGDSHGGFVPPVFPASEETVVGDAAAATRVMDEETVADVSPKPASAGYVDLGLPSGTLWKTSNECNSSDDHGYYTYEAAVRSFGNSLPTKVQLEELVDKCTWTWNSNKKGYDVKGANGNSIFLPAAGYRTCAGGVGNVKFIGYYWSSTFIGSEYAWELYFDSDTHILNDGNRCGGQSVRLVQAK